MGSQRRAVEVAEKERICFDRKGFELKSKTQTARDPINKTRIKRRRHQLGTKDQRKPLANWERVLIFEIPGTSRRSGRRG